MDRKEIYQTINVLILASLIAHLVSDKSIFLWISLVLLINNILFFRVNELLSRFWLKFALFIGHINTRILLTLIFFIFLTPIAFLYRIFNGKRIAYFNKDIQESYFEKANLNYDQKYFTKQW